MTDFSNRLRQLRRQRGLTLQALADPTGIHANQLGRYERGMQPSIDAIARLSRFFGIDARELVGPVLDRAMANSPTVSPNGRGAR